MNKIILSLLSISIIGSCSNTRLASEFAQLKGTDFLAGVALASFQNNSNVGTDIFAFTPVHHNDYSTSVVSGVDSSRGIYRLVIKNQIENGDFADTTSYPSWTSLQQLGWSANTSVVPRVCHLENNVCSARARAQSTAVLHVKSENNKTVVYDLQKLSGYATQNYFYGISIDFIVVSPLFSFSYVGGSAHYQTMQWEMVLNTIYTHISFPYDDEASYINKFLLYGTASGLSPQLYFGDKQTNNFSEGYINAIRMVNQDADYSVSFIITDNGLRSGDYIFSAYIRQEPQLKKNHYATRAISVYVGQEVAVKPVNQLGYSVISADPAWDTQWTKIEVKFERILIENKEKGLIVRLIAGDAYLLDAGSVLIAYPQLIYDIQ